MIFCAVRASLSKKGSVDMIRFVCAAILSLAMTGAAIARSASIEARVDAYVKPYLEARSFSGAILIARGGKILVSKGYGMANYELDVPNTPQTRFHIASISKPFTAAAIMMLEERGLLSVNDPLTKFITDYPGGDKITVHHLLIHTSGIANVNDFPDYDAKSKFPQTPESLVAMFKNRPLSFQPGARSVYSNSGYVLLAYIIEKVSSKSYEEFLTENIFRPAGMLDTGDDRQERLLKNRASGYMPAVDESGVINAPFTDNSIKVGAGSLYTTAEDLYRWERAISSKKLMKLTIESIFPARTWFGRRVVTQDGSLPGFNAVVAKFLDDDLWIVVLSNNYSQVRGAIVKDLAAMVLGEKYEIPSVKQPARIAAAAIDALTGSYRFDNSRRGFTIFKNRKGALVMSIAGRDSRVIPQSETEFFVPLWWARFTIAKGDKGEVTHLVWHDHGSAEGMRVPRIREDTK